MTKQTKRLPYVLVVIHEDGSFSHTKSNGVRLVTVDIGSMLKPDNSLTDDVTIDDVAAARRQVEALPKTDLSRELLHELAEISRRLDSEEEGAEIAR